MQTVHFPYTPTQKQRLFHRCTADEALYGGAAGGGKSTALVADAFLRCAASPGAAAYLFRRTYPELEDTLIATARALLPAASGAYAAQAHEFRLKNGSVLRFRHLQHDADVTRYQGAQMQFLYIDELTHFPQGVYDYLKTRVRTKRGGAKPLIRCATNPGGPGHGWVRQRFVERCPAGGEWAEDVYSADLGRSARRVTAYIPARAADNPHLNEGYLFELESKPRALRDALLLGRWDAFEGQVFAEWRAEGEGAHVVAPFPVPAGWPLWCSFDFGYARPFSVGWWAVSPQGRVVRVGEWYGCTATPNEGIQLEPAGIARGILEREEALFPGRQVIRVADPSIFDESRGLSVARQMGAHGVHFARGENRRLAGKMQLHYRLRAQPDGLPGLLVFSTCRAFLRTVPALCYSTLRPEDVDTAAEDHVYDETRYFLMANPVGAPEKASIDLDGWKPPAMNPF